jgi:hypothetical protein
MLDGGYEIELEAVTTNIQEAEVVSLYFPLLRKTLLIDTRSGASAGPLVCVVDMVNTSEERMRALRRMRPQFARPGSITLIPWLQRVDSLCSLGVWEHLVRRLESAGGAAAVGHAAGCLDELRAYERREFRRAITGEQYQTLWGRLGQGDVTPR